MHKGYIVILALVCSSWKHSMRLKGTAPDAAGNSVAAVVDVDLRPNRLILLVGEQRLLPCG